MPEDKIKENLIGGKKLSTKIKRNPLRGIHKAMMLSAMNAECEIIKLIEKEERRGGVAVPIEALRKAIAESFMNELNDTF